MSHIARTFFTIPVAIVTNTCDSPAIDMGFFEKAIIEMPATWTTADIGVKVATPASPAFVPLMNASFLVRVLNPYPSRAYALPIDIAAARLIKLYSCSETGAVNQAADAAIIVTVKS